MSDAWHDKIIRLELRIAALEARTTPEAIWRSQADLQMEGLKHEAALQERYRCKLCGHINNPQAD